MKPTPYTLLCQAASAAVTNDETRLIARLDEVLDQLGYQPAKKKAKKRPAKKKAPPKATEPSDDAGGAA